MSHSAFTLKCQAEAISCLTTTNVGVYVSEPLADGQYLVGTDDVQVFAMWQRELKKAGYTFEVLD